MRGEYVITSNSAVAHKELPPRARRIPLPIVQINNNLGTTSACAENTLEGWPEALGFWNYLRVRGEYAGINHYSHPSMELPPRARRIPRMRVVSPWIRGTTSACAENTDVLELLKHDDRNYLRVRGEYGSSTAAMGSTMELPPRARRIPLLILRMSGVLGTTSACAENTCGGFATMYRGRNYLRVRGEYYSLSAPLLL